MTTPPTLAATKTDAAGAPAFEVRGPAVPTTPLVFACPHAGRFYPASLLQASRLDAHAIRRSEDAYVDALIEPAFALGVSGVICRTARAYVDVNRDPWELDPEMFDEPLPAEARPGTPRVAAGLGSIARLVGEGQEIYDHKLSLEEARGRIDQVHAPYHAALTRQVEAATARFGVAVVVDWHSMPSAAARNEARRGRGRPDMVLGDCHGAACGRPLSSLVRRLLEVEGYLVTMNTPYAGGWTTQTYGRPREGVHALQIEIDRGLYLDEAKLETTAGFPRLRRDLERLTGAMIEMNWTSALRA